MKWLGYLFAAICIIPLLVTGLVGCTQRRLLYFPTHENTAESAARWGMISWKIEGEYTGYAKVMSDPRRVWFFIHGNGGQAGNRSYVLDRIGANDSIYILEYPGYGEREGSPSKSSFDRAALKAYLWLVEKYGVEKIVVLGESLGSGPASLLAKASSPPQQIVLVVPFARLQDVAKEAFRFLPVDLIMLDKWDNIEALRGFKGRLDIFGATDDNVIPVHHARRLAASLPGAVYHEFKGDHGWASGGLVNLSSLFDHGR